jgi:hypothetical protein
MSDKERSAFGLGWDHARRKKHSAANPFKFDLLQWEQYRDGFVAYQSQPSDYEEKLAARQR